MIKIYKGKTILGIGQTFAIITAKENNGFYEALNVMMFMDVLGRELVTSVKSRMPITNGISLEEFIQGEVEACNDDVAYKIIYHNFGEKVDKYGLDINVNFKEAGRGCLMLIRNKYSGLWEKLKSEVKETELESLINLYEVIKIDRTDIDLK